MLTVIHSDTVVAVLRLSNLTANVEESRKKGKKKEKKRTRRKKILLAVPES